MNIWQCRHNSAVLVEETEGGKIARCLQCRERGPVCEGSKEAVGALRDRARKRDEAQNA
jgi:hypothetical protein